MNPLYDVLTNAALSVMASGGGDLREAETFHLDAAFAAPEAFPPAPLPPRRTLVLGAVGDMARGVPA